ncbi:MAG TPA: nickel pincer cofactor biosynthesis protein LarC [Clostridia bacterium]|nr:nickel pincer cofactor biosynthesis protein LarC [Clostridia bacterium]
MKILYFDCFAGISGDMTIASLLYHVDEEEFKKQVKKIALDNFDVKIEQTRKKSINAKTFKVLYEEEHHHHHRHLKDVREIIEKSDLEEEVKKKSIEMFEKLAEAEAKVHGKSVEEIHFHEVGAVDSIVDIIGTAILIHMIKPDKIVSSPLPVTSGFVKTQHGLMPVPAPATAELLKGIPVYKSDIEGEIVTPTGAVIIKTLANEFSGVPDMTIHSIGYGAGNKELEIPNLLRTYVGEEEVKKNLSR